MDKRVKADSAGAETREEAPHPSIASALRTLDIDREGLAALAAAMRDGLGNPFIAAVDKIRSRARPRYRHRHGQIRPRRPQDRRDIRFHRYAGVLRACRRSQPRRPRHGYLRRRDADAVVVGRDRRTDRPDQLLAPVRHRADRNHRQCREYARQGRRHRADDAADAGSLPAQSRADDVIAAAACARRRAGDCADRKPRIHRSRFRRVSSARQARRRAQIHSRRDASRRIRAADPPRCADVGSDRGNVGQRLRLRRGHRRRPANSPA